MAESLKRLGCPAERLCVLPPDVEVDRIRFESEVWRPYETLRVLMVASFREKKGLPYGLEALRAVRSDVRDIQITIVGDASGDTRSQLEKTRILQTLERTGLARETRLLGYQPHPVLLEEAYGHHIFLSPSVTASDGDTEGGAAVMLIEIAASGIPVVSIQHCDIPPVLLDGETGLLAAERDARGLSERLLWLVAHRAWADVSASREKARGTQF